MSPYNMAPGLTIEAVDRDNDYLGVEIRVSSGRFSGSAFVFAGFRELSEFADQISGFPAGHHDDRTHEFGKPGGVFAGGYCKVRLRCLDRAGHVTVDVELEDDDQRYAHESARLSFQTEAALIDEFVQHLRSVEDRGMSVAALPSA